MVHLAPLLDIYFILVSLKTFLRTVSDIANCCWYRTEKICHMSPHIIFWVQCFSHFQGACWLSVIRRLLTGPSRVPSRSSGPSCDIAPRSPAPSTASRSRRNRPRRSALWEGPDRESRVCSLRCSASGNWRRDRSLLMGSTCHTCPYRTYG